MCREFCSFGAKPLAIRRRKEPHGRLWLRVASGVIFFTQRGENMQKLKSVVGTALALITASSVALAQSQTQKLRGDFAFSGGATCLVSPAPNGVAPAGFTADLVPIRGPGIPPAFALSFSIQGVRTFNGDGTGSMVARTVSVREPGTGVNTNPG